MSKKRSDTKCCYTIPAMSYGYDAEGNLEEILACGQRFTRARDTKEISQADAPESGETAENSTSKDEIRDFDDSREQLEADIRAWHRDTQFAAKPSVQTLLGWLDRQASITAASFDCNACADSMSWRISDIQAKVDELEAERDRLADERHRYKLQCERWEAKIAELEAERDKLKERVARFDSISSIDGIVNLLVQFEDLTAERDKLLQKKITDELHAQLCNEDVGRFAYDNVTSPKHYISSESDGLECIDAIKASMSSVEFAGYLRGNVIKYIWRFRKKGGVEDLEKARWYLDKLIEEERNDR